MKRTEVLRFMALLLLLAEAPIHSLYKHVCCPGPARLAVMDVVIERRFGLLNLIEGHALSDHVLNPVANNRQHRLVFDNIGLVAEPSVAWNDVGSTLLLVRWNGQLNNVIQAGDNSLDAAASLQIDHGIVVDVKKVARAYYIGTPEKDDRIAICMRPRFVVKDDCFSIEEELLFFR